MNLVFFIPITAIVMGIGIGMLGLWTDHKRKSQMLEQTHRERMAAIEKGIELPPMPSTSIIEASQAAKGAPNPAKILRSGVFMLSLGVVLYFALITVGAGEAAVFGLIPGDHRTREPGLCSGVVRQGAQGGSAERKGSAAAAVRSPSTQVGDQRGAHVFRRGRDLVLIVRVVDADGQRGAALEPRGHRLAELESQEMNG